MHILKVLKENPKALSSRRVHFSSVKESVVFKRRLQKAEFLIETLALRAFALISLNFNRD